MAKLATDILAIQEMINSFKNSNLKIEDIFQIINKNKGFFLETTNQNMLEIDEMNELDEFDMSLEDFEKSKTKKGKRYLN